VLFEARSEGLRQRWEDLRYERDPQIGIADVSRTMSLPIVDLNGSLVPLAFLAASGECRRFRRLDPALNWGYRWSWG